MSLLESFETELHRQSVGCPVCTWEHGRRRTRNIVQVGSGQSTKLIYVKVRNEAPGFWGLNQNQLGSLRSSGMPWYVVLIEGSGGTHYLLPASRVEDAIQARRWTQSDGDYKIHENGELEGSVKFESAAAVIGRILTAG